MAHKRKRTAKPKTDVERRVQDRVRELRRGGGWTIAELAEAADISVDALTRIESGERVPTLNTLVDLATALGVTVTELFDEPDPRYSAATMRLVQLAEGQAPKVRKAILDVVRRFVGCLEDAQD